MMTDTLPPLAFVLYTLYFDPDPSLTPTLFGASGYSRYRARRLLDQCNSPVDYSAFFCQK